MGKGRKMPEYTFYGKGRISNVTYYTTADDEEQARQSILAGLYAGDEIGTQKEIK